MSWKKNIEVGGRRCGSERGSASLDKFLVLKGHGDGRRPGYRPQSWGTEECYDWGFRLARAHLSMDKEAVY